MKISIIQTDLVWENKKVNLDTFKQIIDTISEETDLIILPEMFSTGFSMSASLLAEDINGPTVSWMKEIAAKKKCAITGSIILKSGKHYFNCLIWADEKQLLTYNKRHLFTYSGENNHYSAGTEKTIVHYRGWNILPLICYDLRFPVWSRRTKKENYDLLIYVANWPERRNVAWKTLLPARAIENQSFVVGVNRIGNDNKNIFHSGDSAVYDFKGEKLSSLSASENKYETIELNLTELIKHRETFSFGNDADYFELK